MSGVRTRFAPSPTGDLHVGGARTALFSYLEAKHRGGEFILRIEDTDLERSTPSAVKAILDGMNWLGLHYDDGPYYQTKRFARYREVAEKLLHTGNAYRCYCSKDELESTSSLVAVSSADRAQNPLGDTSIPSPDGIFADDLPAVLSMSDVPSPMASSADGLVLP